MSDKLVIEDTASIQGAINTFRKGDAPENWVNLKLKEGSKNILILAGTGTGGVDEFKSTLPQNEPSWGLIKLKDTVNKTETETIEVIKFVFIQWLPNSTPLMVKSNLSVLRSQINKVLEPFHVDMTPFDNTDDISEADMRARLREASGEADKTREVNRGDEPQPASKPLKAGQQHAPIKSSGQLKYENREAIDEALKNVRNGTTNFCLIGYVANSKDTLEIKASGNGGPEELATLFNDKEVMYGFVSVSDSVDADSGGAANMRKYVVVHWLGPNTPIMAKGKVSVVKGEVDSLIGQRHISIDCSVASDCNTSNLTTLVGKASGSKSNVKE